MAMRHICALLLVLCSFAAPAAGQDRTVPSDSTELESPRPGWSFAAPGRTRFRTRHAASFLASIPTALLLVLYLHRRRTYLLAWVCAWILLAGMLYGVATSADLIRVGRSQVGGLAIGLARSLGVVGAGLLCAASVWFRQRTVSPRWIPVAVAVIVWLASSAAIVGLPATLVTSYLVLCALYILGGVLYLQTWRKVRMMGPAVISIGLIGVACTYAYALLLVARGLAAIEAPNVTVFVSVAWHALVVVGMHLMVFEDMSAELHATNLQLAETERDLQEAATLDALTGCYNRRFFMEIAAREVERHRRHGLPMSLVFMDCDNLKAINDSSGHPVGDDVLRIIGRLLLTHLRRSDFVFRWGGDEFVAMMSCDADQAQLKADEIQRAFRADPIVRQLPMATGLSVGCIDVPTDTTELLPLVSQADHRMYINKWKTA